MKYESEKIISSYNDNWQQWIDIAKHQEFSSGYLFPPLLNYFDKNKPILELGAGVGQLCKIAQHYGYNVVASDYCDAFVDYMTNEKLVAEKIDALNIPTGQKRWHGIYTQGLSVLVTKDLDTVLKTYKSIYDALAQRGKFIFIFPRAKKTKFSRAAQHKQIYTQIGFKEIEVFRQQAFPATLYRKNLIGFLEKYLGKLIGIRDIIILEK
ncbi:methyltransferase [Candidatus Thiomargarita nelsonii]|uniref:Methyltransferase n=1 Tax=Candidatus Thiomargarita nelsonii TaxID=1003181 RepID=A0A176S7Z9_9GAMM|nr:methyltransferase [Candidatus Thiomargarita nelsonii]